MTKRILVFLLATLAFSQGTGTIHTPADITGDASAHQMFTSATSALWVSFIAPSGNGAVVRIGDSTTSATVGQPIAAGGSFFMPVRHAPGREGLYDLTSLYYYAGSGDKISVAWSN